MCHRTLGAERPVQHQQRPVTPFSVENGWLTFGLRGVYLYSSTSSMGGLLPICSVENHLVVQERSKSLKRIEIGEISGENPSLVDFQESSVHPPLSSALFGSSESSLFVTLGDRHHLDGSVVIGGTKITRSSCGWLVSSL